MATNYKIDINPDVETPPQDVFLMDLFKTIHEIQLELDAEEALKKKENLQDSIFYLSEAVSDLSEASLLMARIINSLYEGE